MKLNQVYICDGLRTPIGRYGGSLSGVRADDMLAHVIEKLLHRSPRLDVEGIGEIVAGCANQAGEDNRNVARMAALLSGLPVTVPAITVNRLCASGMDAIAIGSRRIACGEIDVALAGGVESMSRAPLVMAKAEVAFSRKAEIYDTTIGWRFVNKKLAEQYGIDSMPETGENVAEKYGISREDQDLFAYRSQKKVSESRDLLQQEITSIILPQRKADDIIFSQDEHPRENTELAKLASLKTPFRENGTVTAGNASGVNDGACVLLLASEHAVKKYGLNPICRINGFQSAGVEPGIMGIGPVPAVNRLLEKQNLSLESIDVIELNEAFAAQSLAVLRQLHIADDDARVNTWGGAIALGHPLGMSGARLVLTASRQLHHHQGKLGLCTMCVGVGQGVAMLIERL